MSLSFKWDLENLLSENIDLVRKWMQGFPLEPGLKILKSSIYCKRTDSMIGWELYSSSPWSLYVDIIIFYSLSSLSNLKSGMASENK